MTTPAITIATTLLVLSVPIFLVFGIGGAMIAVGDLNLPWATFLQVSVGAVTKHVLLAIPLFIFAGFVMLHAGVAERLVNLSIAMVGHLPGGLGIAMIVTMGFFAAFCGSVLAAISAVGMIMMPIMVEKGYPPAFVVVLAAASGTLETLIPPSNGAIIFSALTAVPVSKTFAAGILPGIVLMIMLIIYVSWYCKDMERPAKATRREKWLAFTAAIPGLVTPVLILGGIYLGLLTPSESAAVASLWAILVGFLIHRELTLGKIWEALKVTAITTTIIFSVIAMATFLSVVLAYTRLPHTIIDFFLSYGVTPVLFLFAVGFICLILGTFLEVVPIFYLTIPVFVGVATALQIDMMHMYIVFSAFVAIGLLTPPVCVGIYISAAVIDVPPEQAFRKVPGFVLIGLLYAILMIFFPIVSTFLPSKV